MRCEPGGLVRHDSRISMASNSSRGGHLGGRSGSGGWREVVVLVTMGLRLVLEVMMLSSQAADPLHDVISTSTLGNALLVMFLLTVGLTDGQGFITCLLYLPSFFKRSSLSRSPSQSTLGMPEHGA